MSSVITRLALATILVGPTIGFLATPAAAEPSTGPCGPAVVERVIPPLQEPDTQSPSCQSELEECLSANARQGTYGEEYVPPDAVGLCYDAYRACTAERPEEEGVG